MKADDANLLDLLKKSNQFVVPIYQRVYSWGRPECQRLWDDVVYAGVHEGLQSHFTGSIVYVERGEGTRTSAEPDLIIDGQQRVTTVMLLLLALARRLEELPEGEREPVEGFSPTKIRNRYLTNPDEDGDRFFKLILSKTDREALKWLIHFPGGRSQPPESVSRVLDNYDYFASQLDADGVDLVAVCLGLRKLVVVDVKLTRGADNPQLVFETMNSTGKRLSQADLIRNFVLMDLPPSKQTRLYEEYWAGLETWFASPNEARFDEFVRHYLTYKSGSIPKVGEVYDAFKLFAEQQEREGSTREVLVGDLHRHAGLFVRMALGHEPSARLRRHFQDLEQLKATVVYPFLLRVYVDYENNVLTDEQFEEILVLVTSYLFRRAVCRIPTNSLNTTFAALGSGIIDAEYVTSIAARLSIPTANTRFPDDEEFTAALSSLDLYHFARRIYFMRRLENHGRKERVTISDYTIEHILPQNENLSAAWQRELGPNWKTVQENYLHTLGNLTLTGYNSEYSDRPFLEKRDMPGGFAQSPLRLNAGLGELDSWNEEQIRLRADRLARLALDVWPHPRLPEATLTNYRRAMGSSFDWSLTHQILEEIPAGRWTTYKQLADAVGTWPQPLANHLSRCTACTHAYRVLNADGRIAEGFAWTRADETRPPLVVLAEEGVRFSSGAADPTQLLGTEELLALVDA